MAEYTGDVVPLEAPTNPATGKPFGTMVNAAGKANKETADEFGKKNDSWQSWLNNPAGYVAAGGLAAEAARRVIPYLKDRLNPPPLEQIEPTFNVEPPVQPPVQQVVQQPVQPVQQVNPLDEHRIRKAAAEADLAELKVQQAKSAAAPTTPKAAPTSVVPPPQPVAPTPPVAQPAQPIVPTQAPAAPSFGKGTDMPLNPFTTDIQKIAQVTNPTTAAMAEVATGKVPEMVGPVKPPDIATRVRRTAEEIAAAKAEALANAPEGMRPVPPNSKYNKAPGEKIGVGGYTYAHGAYGPETQARWEEQYGKTNVPYEKVKSDISLAQMGPHKEGVSKEFQFSRPKYAPNYIKGAVSPEMLNAVLNKANLAGALMTPTTASAPTVQDYKKQNQGRGAVNPKDVDPTEWGDKYAAFLKMMQSMVGDKTPYLHR